MTEKNKSTDIIHIYKIYVIMWHTNILGTTLLTNIFVLCTVCNDDRFSTKSTQLAYTTIMICLWESKIRSVEKKHCSGANRTAQLMTSNAADVFRFLLQSTIYFSVWFLTMFSLCWGKGFGVHLHAVQADRKVTYNILWVSVRAQLQRLHHLTHCHGYRIKMLTQ